MSQKINQRYKVTDSSSLVSILKKMKEYDVNYQIESKDGVWLIRCYTMDLGQQNIMSSFKNIKKISWY